MVNVYIYDIRKQDGSFCIAFVYGREIDEDDMAKIDGLECICDCAKISNLTSLDVHAVQTYVDKRERFKDSFREIVSDIESTISWSRDPQVVW